MKQYANGLFAAANSSSTGYHRVWIRDNVYTLLGLEKKGDWQTVAKALHGLLDILKKHEYKIDWMIKQPLPKDKYRYIHPRYDPNGNEVMEEWGNKQNDAIGALLWKIGDACKRKRLTLRDGDLAMIQKLVDYLSAIEYWKDADNGMWEENEEVHASSVGACLAGLLAVSELVTVPLHLIAHGENTLRKLLPRESVTKDTDLALLSLIYPYNVVTPNECDAILQNVEKKLVRAKGVCRYVGDKYYSNGKDAEWTMGLCWLAIIYKQLGDAQKHEEYLRKAKDAFNDDGELPELYFGETSEHNENTPLAWAMSLWDVAN